MINKIKEFIRKWLFKNELGDIHILQLEVKRLNGIIQHNEELIKEFLATCQTGYDLGVSKYHKNWCVFVKQGRSDKQDFVKFIDLSHMNYNEIVNFEKHLEHLNGDRKYMYRHVDAPLGVKDYFVFK